MYTLSNILRDVGHRNVAEVTQRTIRQIYTWEKNNTLPRTEFSGETNFAEAISTLSGGKYSKEEILRAAIDGRKVLAPAQEASQ